MLGVGVGGRYEMKNKTKNMDRTMKPLIIFLGFTLPYRVLRRS